MMLARGRPIWRRLAIASVIVLLLHILFMLFVAPQLEFDRAQNTPTEVVQISPEELNKLKERMKKNRELSPLMKNEVLEEYRTKEAPKDATMMGPHNQIVPKEKVAGPQADAPQEGGGGSKTREAQKKKLDLSKLGLGSKPLPPPPKPEEEKQTGAVGPKGPPGTFRPVGRDDKMIEKGDQNLLNAVESEFYSFFVRLEEPIIKNWYFLLRSNETQLRQEMAQRKIKSGSELPVTLEFVLDQQGNFKKIDIIQSSGIPILDWATKESVRKLGALPNPPAGLFKAGQYFTRQLQFLVHVTDMPIVNSRPDLYW